MKIKITCADGEYQAGLIYDAPEDKALELIAADKAIVSNEEVIAVTAYADPMTVFIEAPTKKVKHADR